ncbi:phospholipase D-like domain-containing protein [Aureivirga marina]|uniref:phospholipase D-like domain-containing protein n=1 Tax=Aureivirga marina TaxID=1182451 RepID=UPI0018C9D550|nr:phospholipase D-like domain-containing protein [Aureivirga marina]
MLKATFQNIKSQLSELISESKESILISVAWFTSKDLLGQLENKAEQGCKVEIMVSDHFENKRISFKNFQKKGGSIKILPTKSGKFLHDKFAVFDNKIVASGSYNWTNSAEYYNHEIIIISDDKTLVKQFNFRFQNLQRIVKEYDEQILINNQLINRDIKEEEFSNLEKDLEQDFVSTIKEANKLGAKINSEMVLDYIHRYGAIGGATRLINKGTENLQSGLIKLFEINKLDISFENIILKEKYKVLFDKNTIENAEKRLIKLNFKP